MLNPCPAGVAVFTGASPCSVYPDPGFGTHPAPGLPARLAGLCSDPGIKIWLGLLQCHRSSFKNGTLCSDSKQIDPWGLGGYVCHLVKWQMWPLNSRGRIAAQVTIDCSQLVTCTKIRALEVTIFEFTVHAASVIFLYLKMLMVYQSCWCFQRGWYNMYNIVLCKGKRQYYGLLEK